MKGPLTWRQLVVAQSGAAKTAEVAVGYRVAAAKRQWLVYRSLAEQANRSVLGHNLATEDAGRPLPEKRPSGAAD